MELLIENHARWIDLANKQREKVKSSSFSIQTVPILCHQKRIKYQVIDIKK